MFGAFLLLLVVDIKTAIYMVGRERLERSTIGLKVRCSTN